MLAFAVLERARFLPAAFMLAGLLAQPPAQAQMFKDSALQAVYKEDRPAELHRIATQRLAAQPADSQAVLALALAALQGNAAEARRTAIGQAERCLQQQPQAAACHYALGVVLGVQAMSEGLLKAARSAGTVKTALTQAQTLEPSWYAARRALVEFYLLAPGVMGGSTSRAVELAKDAPTPEQARVLQARVELQDEKVESVIASLMALLSARDSEVAEDAAQWGFQAAIRLINNDRAPLALPFLERLQQQRPDAAAAPFGLARVRAAAGAHEEALKLYEQSATGKDAAMLPVDYRRGLALEALGRKDEAKAAYSRFLAAGRGFRGSLEDAKKRLEALGG